MGDERESHPLPAGRILNRAAHPRRAAQAEHEPRGAAGSGAPETVRVRLLGGFRVSVGSGNVRQRDWRLKKAAALVKLLALAPRHALHREVVMDHLWPNLDAEAAANNLHRTLYAARRALDPHDSSRYLRLKDEQLRLCPDGQLWVDAEVFEEAAARARRSREPAAYRAAVELYAGELLPGDRYEEWAQDRREGLRQTHLSLLLEMAGAHEEREDYEPAIQALEKAVAEEPAHEEAHVGLVRLYALSGRREEALRRYERLREDLREFGREPDAASRRLYEEVLAGRFPSVSPPDERSAMDADGARHHNLPAPRTSFVGRERELVEVKRELAMTRLLTLTGAGGCGKTRLALEVARDLVEIYPDGVWLVEFAPLSDPELVPNAVAGALGVPDQPGRPLEDTLADSLRTRKLLLVLDNCEHLIGACARLVDALLGSCEHLRILATSREALCVDGEVTWLVPSLAVPDTDHLPAIQTLTQYEAVGLFVDRARSRLPDFGLTPENARSVAEVCRKLDGIPLAIELATARMGVLAVDQIAERLEDSLKLLTRGSRTAEPRQRTLRATLDWSYGLLSEPERALFRRLSVFAGGWTLEAAEEVCSGEGIEEDEVLDLLSRLVDKSLVVADAGRYRMLEPIRQYAWEQLEDTEEVRERHAEYYLALAESAEPELLGAGQGEWLRRLRTEFGNLRGALSWSMETGQERERAQEELGLQLAAALWRFWDVEGFQEGKRWLKAALERDRGGSPAVRAKALGGLGWILLFQQDYGRAIAALEEAIALYKELGDESGVAFALANLGYAVLHGGYRERMAAFVREAEALMTGDLDDHTRALLRIIVGTAAQEDDLDSAAAQLKEGLALCRELGDLRNASMALFVLGGIELTRGDLDRGATLLEEGARITQGLGDRLGGAYYALLLGKLSALRGKPLRAARLWGAAEALRERMGMSLSRFDLAQSGYEQDLAAVISALSEASFDAAWSEGRDMSSEEAIEYALSDDEPAAPVPEGPPSVLSRRQREVALLIARGLTNRRIAEELSISERTVTTHVDHILGKLGASSRAQVAAWVVEQRPPLREETGSG